MRPSEVLHIEDDYTAFCLDEACEYITGRAKNGEEMTFAEDEKKAKTPTHMSTFYASLGV